MSHDVALSPIDFAMAVPPPMPTWYRTEVHDPRPRPPVEALKKAENALIDAWMADEGVAASPARLSAYIGRVGLAEAFGADLAICTASIITRLEHREAETRWEHDEKLYQYVCWAWDWAEAMAAEGSARWKEHAIGTADEGPPPPIDVSDDDDDGGDA